MNFGPYPEKREIPSFVQKQSGEELALKLLRQHDALDALHKGGFQIETGLVLHADDAPKLAHGDILLLVHHIECVSKQQQ
jgi:hypothetical protein